MAKWKLQTFVSGAIGGSGLSLREMEKFYEKDVKEQAIKQYQPEASTPLAYENEIIFKDKTCLYKDKYFFINLFDKIMYEVTRESR